MIQLSSLCGISDGYCWYRAAAGALKKKRKKERKIFVYWRGTFHRSVWSKYSTGVNQPRGGKWAITPHEAVERERVHSKYSYFLRLESDQSHLSSSGTTKKLQQEVWKETRKSSTAVWRSHLYFFVCSHVRGELQVPESDWFSVFFFFVQSRMTGRLMKLSPTAAAINDRLLQQRWMWQQSLSAVCHSAFAVSTNSWHVQKIWQSQ